jgi:predicted dehydrogenase
MGKAALVSSTVLSGPTLFAKDQVEKEWTEKPIRIGIIGAENSHTRGFGKLFNIDKKFPGVSVEYVWGETEAFAKDAMERGAIPKMVKDPKEMMGKIDALIVDHRHAKYHLPAAEPFVKAGIPTFIDKPFCYRLEEGKAFLEMAREAGTPVTSYSSISHSAATFDVREQLKELGTINQLIRTGPVDLESEYGGIFFYGVHTVQPLLYLFDTDVVKVRVNKNGPNSGANLIFSDGMSASLVFTTKKYGWQTFVETDEGVVELKSRVEAEEPGKNYVDMVHMFRTGEEPRSHEHILKGVAVLEALERSVESEQWEAVEAVS